MPRKGFPSDTKLVTLADSRNRSNFVPLAVRSAGVIVAISASKGRPVGGCPRCSMIGVGDRLSLDGRCGTPELFPLQATGLFASRQWVPLVQMRF